MADQPLKRVRQPAPHPPSEVSGPTPHPNTPPNPPDPSSSLLLLLKLAQPSKPSNNDLHPYRTRAYTLLKATPRHDGNDRAYLMKLARLTPSASHPLRVA
jgi:hypothetical protein